MEEISLRECIEVLLRGKWIIAIVSAISILLSVVYAQFMMKPVYIAKATLMVSPVVAKAAEDEQNRFSELVDSLSRYPQMTLDTYKEQVLTLSVLDTVIEALNLDESYGIDRVLLKDMVEVELPEKTNLIYVGAKHADPQLAAEIANTLSQKYVDFISDKIQYQTGRSAEFIARQLNLEKENVDKTTAALTAFLARPRGVSELRQELSSKLSQLTGFKTNVTQVQINMEATDAALERARQALKTTPDTLKTTKSLVSDTIREQKALESAGVQSNGIEGLQMTDEQLNPAYTSLLLNVKNYEIQLARHKTQLHSLQREIEMRQREIEQLQAELAEKENEYRTLSYEVNLAKQTRDAYQQKLKEANIKQSAEIGKSSVIMVAEALPPLYPTNSKMLIVAIAGILGLMVSGFAVFFKEYWEKPAYS